MVKQIINEIMSILQFQFDGTLVRHHHLFVPHPRRHQFKEVFVELKRT
jgi:hypothetical protein